VVDTNVRRVVARAVNGQAEAGGATSARDLADVEALLPPEPPAAARFSAALAGTALVFAPYFLRQWIGRWGALAASALLLVSPSALYYSRFIREDIFVALWTAGLFIGYTREAAARYSFLLAIPAGHAADRQLILHVAPPSAL